MNIKEILSEFEWDLSVKLGIIISTLSLIIGLVFTDSSFLGLLIATFIPILMLLYPYFWLWFVPRKFFTQPAPKEYVLVFAWAYIVFNFVDIIIDIKG